MLRETPSSSFQLHFHFLEALNTPLLCFPMFSIDLYHHLDHGGVSGLKLVGKFLASYFSLLFSFLENHETQNFHRIVLALVKLSSQKV